MKFSESVILDVEQIREWAAVDPYHYLKNEPEWWLTGNGLLSFCLMDDEGPLCYVRIDGEGDLVRLHTQFAPQSIVSKRRLIVGMMRAIELLIEHFRLDHKGMIFNSVNPSLIRFMSKFGFKAVGKDDYQLIFGEG